MKFGGTLLNTFTVIFGSIVGLLIGGLIPVGWQPIIQGAIGLVTLGAGMSMFLKSKNMLIVVSAVTIGGIIGLALGISAGFAQLAENFRNLVGGDGNFNEGFIAASVLYCVGPMTLLGCIEDGIKGKSELLRLKSVLDGVTSVFFASSLGVGVLASAATVFVVQGVLTALARFLRPVADHPDAMGEATATGGILMLAIGFGLIGVKSIPAETFLPALFMAPAIVLVTDRVGKRKNSGASPVAKDVESGDAV